MLFRSCLILATLVGNVADARGPERGAAAHPATLSRDRLMAGELSAGSDSGPVDNGYFMSIGEPLRPACELGGTIRFFETLMRTTHPEETWEGFGMRYFPGFSVRFLSHAGHLIPADRGIILSGEKRRSPWNIIVSPGRVWREPGDGDRSRGSFPFTLTTNGVGQARNGLATFVYDETSISSVFIQITQETSPASEYSRDDFSAFIRATYAPHMIPDRDAVLEGFHQEVERRLPVLPWTSLEDASSTPPSYDAWKGRPHKEGTDVERAGSLNLLWPIGRFYLRFP
jgi:hypothetical protein